MSNVVETAGEVVMADAPGVVNDAPQDIAPEGERPSWLPDKFESPEMLAESYANLEAKLQTKTEDFKTSLLEEIEAEQSQSQVNETIPDAADGYVLPEGMAAEDHVLEAFQDWAFERDLGQDDFEELAQFYAQNMTPDLEVEAAKIGTERLTAVNQWIGANVDESFYPALSKIMTTADNVEAIEAIMKLTVPSSMPGQSNVAEAGQPEPQKTKAEIMEIMSTKEYMDPIHRNPELVETVTAWFQANAASE